MKAHAFKVYSAAKAVAMPERVKGEAEYIFTARIACIKRMGNHWLLHPDYVFNPRHSNDPSVYRPARSAYVEKVAQLGKLARARNPAFARADAISRAIGGAS